VIQREAPHDGILVDGVGVIPADEVERVIRAERTTPDRDSFRVEPCADCGGIFAHVNGCRDLVEVP
jgi:hypothetical protein